MPSAPRALAKSRYSVCRAQCLGKNATLDLTGARATPLLFAPHAPPPPPSVQLKQMEPEPAVMGKGALLSVSQSSFNVIFSSN